MDLYSDKTPDSLRAHADQLDADADNLLRDANARADEVRRRAADYRRIADEQDAARQPVACRNCGGPIVHDSLGWAHVTFPDAAEFDHPAEPMDATVVDQPAEAATVAEGEAL
jgi:hypothetical protein